jgi:hypothetical protein
MDEHDRRWLSAVVRQCSDEQRGFAVAVYLGTWRSHSCRRRLADELAELGLVSHVDDDEDQTSTLVRTLPPQRRQRSARRSAW